MRGTTNREHENAKNMIQKQSTRFGSMNRAANSQNRAVIRMKLTVLSSLAAIQIELTIVMHWKSAGTSVMTVVAKVTMVETIHSISDSIDFKNRTRGLKKTSNGR